MCNTEDDGERQPTKFEKESKLGQKCVKCDQPGVLITRIHDAFCKECYHVYVVHKFRAAIGKSKLIREGEHVLVAFSGGTNSAALLHLIEHGLSPRAHRKLRFIPTLLHIDECGVVGLSDNERQDIRKKVAQVMLKSGFPSYICNLENVVDMENRHGQNQNRSLIGTDRNLADLIEDPIDNIAACLPDANKCDKLKALVNGLASLTSQEDVIRNLRIQMVATVARQMVLSKVLAADCSTRLSVRILTDVAQGRGSQVSLNTRFADPRNDDVMFIRPVRDLNAKELAMYNSLFGVESVFIPTITTKGAPGCSIERLTETFVTGLQAEFPSTVPNIVRTSEKLGLPDLQSSAKCSFCQSPLDTNVGKASALHAIEFSRKLSQKAHTRAAVAGRQAGHQVMEASSSSDQNQRSSTELELLSGDTNSSTACDDTSSCSTAELLQSLCFGCRLSLHNHCDDISTLPPFVRQNAAEMKRQNLRDEISNFLLNEEDDAS